MYIWRPLFSSRPVGSTRRRARAAGAITGTSANTAVTSIAAVVCCCVVLGCGKTTPSAPPTMICGDPIAGIGVYVTDRQTGRAIGTTTTVVATLSPAYADTTRPIANTLDSVPLLAGYHAGEFELAVSRPGYAPWTRANVSVPPSAAPCDGNPASRVRVDAALERVDAASSRQRGLR
jgi:hypothetical protein